MVFRGLAHYAPAVLDGEPGAWWSICCATPKCWGCANARSRAVGPLAARPVGRVCSAIAPSRLLTTP